MSICNFVYSPFVAASEPWGDQFCCLCLVRGRPSCFCIHSWIIFMKMHIHFTGIVHQRFVTPSVSMAENTSPDNMMVNSIAGNTRDPHVRYAY